ncbi:MAG: hypothetical protein N2035_04565 [Chthoniobacterales bacterium]|nr:hypothetical protein [Chthoniobacterales bacterium]
MQTRFLLDLVHHNPGEPPLQTRFTDPSYLASLGYTGQVLKHINACVPLENFPSSPEEQAWLSSAQAQRDAEIAAAKNANLQIFYHIDLFVLPKSLVEKNKSQLCDEKGRIDVTRQATLELHRKLLDAIFLRFPQIDGLVIRVGETYLFDTPHHCGNTAVPMHDDSISRDEMIRRFTLLLQFLREEICIRHRKWLIYRTWDYFSDRFHANPEFYLRVTNAIQPHPLLLFSIKHTAGDFFRGCLPNPCLGIGNHPQIIEVQCAREYEGKGAFPNYIARGVIDGFPEVPNPIGLRHWLQSPLIVGLWTWSRGGGWFGPYLQNELWPNFNIRVLLTWFQNPSLSEADAFYSVCSSHLGMDTTSANAMRELCLIAEQAIWLGRSVPAFAHLRNFQDPDCAWLWMRDDRLGGLRQLSEMFSLLHKANLLQKAIEEKKQAAVLFDRILSLAEKIQTNSLETSQALLTSAHYGLRLFHLIAIGWEIMARRWLLLQNLPTDPISQTDLQKFTDAVQNYRAVEKMPYAASLYQLSYWSWPGQPPSPGLEDSVLNSSS